MKIKIKLIQWEQSLSWDWCPCVEAEVEGEAKATVQFYDHPSEGWQVVGLLWNDNYLDGAVAETIYEMFFGDIPHELLDQIAATLREYGSKGAREQWLGKEIEISAP